MKLWALFLTLTLSSTLFAKESLFAKKEELSTYSKLDVEVFKFLPKYQPENILVVFDVDNTLLQNNIALGSEQWFYWQEGLLATESPQKVAKDFAGLLKVQGLLFDLDPMKLTDETADEAITKLQARGIKTIVLTSRGSDYRSTTERTLKRQGIQFGKNKIGQDIGGEFLPYTSNGKELSKDELTLLGNRPALPVSYGSGIFMTSGQHKGLMLKLLMKKFSYEPSLIVFVDNQERQVNRVYETFNNVTNVITYRFSGMDKKFAAFDSKQAQDKADSDWKNLKTFLENFYRIQLF